MAGARTAGLARAVLERARRRRRQEPEEEREAGSGLPPPQRGDPERLGAAFASLASLVGRAAAECEKYYRLVPAWRCKEHEVKHICRYHSRQAGEKEFEPSKEEKNASTVESSRARTCHQRTRKASKDIYIEVSPGTYSITATSEDMVKQTHVVDISAGQSIDLTFVL
ncbi:A-kinase-interacting protein 1 [Oxyura jamaicensis]|uniref:A-kinase-interacting protein 1 n=1 Tax=Oxyura jamaicensis TaxID=8884 RepID=UPI0015A6598C|nr:A-kinase-interacting protein 1 [Oxyura jamaicensis]